jgi:hypothetical protein
MTVARSFSCVLLTLASACHTETHEEHLDIEEPVVSLEVDVGSGDLEIVGAGVDEVNVSAKIEGASNHLGHSLEDGRLTLFDDCNEVLCGVNITAFVPAAVPVVLRTGSGDVRARGTRAEVWMRTGSGDIDAHELLGIRVHAETGSGDVALRVQAPAENVVVRTGSGDVELVVPRGGYRLSVSTGSGDEDVDGVHDDAAAPGSIEVDTGSGDVKVRGR